MLSNKYFQFILMLFIVLGFESSYATCNIYPKPDTVCTKDGDDITNLSWTPNEIQRNYLFQSEDVQNTNLGCRNFAYLLQTECDFETPVTAVFFPKDSYGQVSETTVVIQKSYNLSKEPSISSKFKEYFAGTLKPEPIASISEVRNTPKVLNTHSRGQVQNFLQSSSPGKYMQFFASCKDPGMIVSDGYFMASCTKGWGTTKNKIILQRIKSGCTGCIGRIERLLGRFDYHQNTSALSSSGISLGYGPNITSVKEFKSYTNTKMPLMSQLSPYIPLAMGFDTQTNEIGYCAPTAAAMALYGLKSRSSVYTVTGNVFDVPGCTHQLGGTVYGHCSLNIAKAAEALDAVEDLKLRGGTPTTKFSRLNFVTNRGEFKSAPYDLVTADYDYVGWDEHAETHTGYPYYFCKNKENCDLTNWMQVPENQWMKTISGNLSGVFVELNASFRVRKSVANPFPLDARKTWVLGMAPALFYDDFNHAVTVSSIYSNYVTVNDPHGIRYNIKPTPCLPELKKNGIEAKFLLSQKRINNQYVEFKRRKYYLYNKKIDGDPGTCLVHTGGASSALFKSSPAWVLTHYWNALPWGSGPVWDQLQADRQAGVGQSLIAEQTGKVRVKAFTPSNQLEKCRSNVLQTTVGAAGGVLEIKSKGLLDVDRVGLTKVQCDQFSIRSVDSTKTPIRHRYGNITLSCQNDSPKLENVECSDKPFLHVPVANGRAYRFWNETLKDFSQEYVVDACNGNWSVDVDKNSCVCKSDDNSNQLVWENGEAKCKLICKPGFSPRLWSDGKYHCQADQPTRQAKVKKLAGQTCRFEDKSGKVISGIWKSDVCFAPEEGDVCEYSENVSGTLKSGRCVPPQGSACTVEQFGKSFEGETYLYICRVPNFTSCDYIQNGEAHEGYFMANKCMPPEGLGCTAYYNNQAYEGEYKIGRCYPKDGQVCEVQNGPETIHAVFKNGKCSPPDGTTCTHQSIDGPVTGGSYINGSCRPPNGHPCEAGQEGNKIAGTYVNGQCSVAYGTACDFVTDFGEWITGSIVGFSCRPPNGEKCLVYSSVTKQNHLAAYTNGVCRVPDGTDCSFVNGKDEFIEARFLNNNCRKIEEGSYCKVTLGPNTKGGYYDHNGVCQIEDGLYCRRYDENNNILGGGRIYNNQCSFANGRGCTIKYNGVNYLAAYDYGTCKVSDGTPCTFIDEENQVNLIQQGTFIDNVCTPPQGRQCQAKVTLTDGTGSITYVPGSYQGTKCVANVNLSCSAKVESSWGGGSYNTEGYYIDNVCKPRDGISCSFVQNANFYFGTYKKGVCTPQDGLLCQRDGYFGSYLNGACVLHDGQDCYVNPTDQWYTGKIAEDQCRPAYKAAGGAPVPIEGLSNGTDCVLEGASRIFGVVENSKCVPKDGTSCHFSHQGQPVPGKYENKVCVPRENYPCFVDNYGTLRDGKFIDGICTPEDDSFCTYLDQNFTVQNSSYLNGECIEP